MGRQYRVLRPPMTAEEIQAEVEKLRKRIEFEESVWWHEPLPDELPQTQHRNVDDYDDDLPF